MFSHNSHRFLIVVLDFTTGYTSNRNAVQQFVFEMQFSSLSLFILTVWFYFASNNKQTFGILPLKIRHSKSLDFFFGAITRTLYKKVYTAKKNDKKMLLFIDGARNQVY